MKSFSCIAVSLLLVACSSEPSGRKRLSFAASDYAEYEGELRFGISSPSDGPPPPVRVITKNDRVEQIALGDRLQPHGSVEVFTFTGTKLTRFQIVSNKSGKPEVTHGPGSEVVIKEQLVANLLLRHFFNKGGYRRVVSTNRSLMGNLHKN